MKKYRLLVALPALLVILGCGFIPQPEPVILEQPPSTCAVTNPETAPDTKPEPTPITELPGTQPRPTLPRKLPDPIAKKLVVGQPVPELEAVDLDGKKFKLSDCKGKVVVVQFWASWCPHCREIYPFLKSYPKKMKGKPVVFLGVNADADQATAKKVIKDNGFTFPNVFDGRGGSLLRDWGVYGIPMSFTIDTKGVLRYQNLAEKSQEQVVDALLKEQKPKGKK